MQRATTALFSTAKRLTAVQLHVTSRVRTHTTLSTITPLHLRITSHGSFLGKNMVMAMNTSASHQLRGYAKKSSKGGKGGKKGSSDEEEEDDNDSGSRKGGKSNKSSGSGGGDMTFDIVDLEKKMGQCLERLKKDFSTMRAGTANPAILDPIKVKAGNSLVSLRDVGQVSIKDAKTLMVNVNDPELIVAVEKAIREAGLNLNPIADNKAVKVPVPKPTKEFRETLSKNAAAAAEKSKTIIRKLRQDGMKDLKKDLKAGMSEDENFTLEKKAQALHDKVIKDIDEALKSKAKEIMSN